MAKQNSDVKGREAASFYNKVADMFCYLLSRWQDESAYENWDDYKKAMGETVTKAGAELLEFTNSPMQLVVRLPKVGKVSYLIDKEDRIIVRVDESEA